MATLETRVGARGTSYRLIFFLHGKRYAETLSVESEEDAQTAKRNAERTLLLIGEGEKEIPAGAAVGLWIATGGKIAQQPTAGNMLPLGDLFDEYVKGNPEGHLEDSTLLTMKIHLGHAARILGKQTSLGSLSFDDLQGYINRRTKEKNRQKNKISPVTVRKEMVTLSGMWSWAASHKKVKGGFPGKKLKYPATTEALRFQTWQEIERQIENGANVKLWDCLFLSTEEIGELLSYVEEYAYKPYVYPMLLTAAHTGARRSELMRSRAEDVDFKANVITIRERKRERGHHGTRSVPMSPLLVKLLKKWLDGRTSGPTFYATPETAITRDEAHSHLELSLADSKWSKVKGWHCLRHSLASNLAGKGIDQRVINEILGHVSEKTAARYRHFAPNVTANAVQSVFG